MTISYFRAHGPHDPRMREVGKRSLRWVKNKTASPAPVLTGIKAEARR
jgi:hypothetical protein